MANSVLAPGQIRAISVSQRLKLIDDVWYSIFERAPEFWFPLAPLVKAEFEQRNYFERDDHTPGLNGDQQAVSHDA